MNKTEGEKMKLKMLNDNILIKEFKEEEKFGIKSEHLSVKAKVYGIGPDVVDIQVNDIIYMSKYTGMPYKEYRIVQEYDILGKEA